MPFLLISSLLFYFNCFLSQFFLYHEGRGFLAPFLMNWPDESDIGHKYLWFCAIRSGRWYELGIVKVFGRQWQVTIYFAEQGKILPWHDAVSIETGSTYEEVKKTSEYVMQSPWRNISASWTTHNILQRFDMFHIRENEIMGFLQLFPFSRTLLENRLAEKYPQIIQNIRVARSLL